MATLNLEPSRIDIVGLRAGSDRTVEFTVRDSAGDTVDVSSGSASLTVREDANADALFTVTCDVATAGASGVISANFSDTNSDQTPGQYVYGLALVVAGLSIDQVAAYGTLEITPRVAA